MCVSVCFVPFFYDLHYLDSVGEVPLEHRVSLDFDLSNEAI